MKTYATGVKLALVLLIGSTVAGCTGVSGPFQSAAPWSRQYAACYDNAFPGPTPPPAERHDATSLTQCLQAQGWTAQA